MTLRRGILGGIALVGAGVAVYIIVSRLEPGREEVASPPRHAARAAPGGPAPAPTTSAGTEAEFDPVTAEPAVTRTEAGWTLRGRLLRYPDADALEPTMPAADARLRLTVLEDAKEPKPDFGPREALSGPDGRYDLAGVPAKAGYRLLVDADGCALRAMTFELPALEEPGEKELPDIVLEEPERLVVLVKGPNGRAVECDKVSALLTTAHEKASREQLRIEQDSIEAQHRGGGEYVFERLARGSHRITAEAPGYSGGEEEVGVPRREDLEVRLQKGQVISGRVRSTAGEPVPFAILEAWGRKSVRADEQGRFVIPDLHCFGSCYVLASAEGFCPVGMDTGVPEIDFILPREAVLAGRVVDAATGEGIEGAAVTGLEEAVTDRSGAFALKVWPGSREISVAHSEYVPLDAGPWDFEEGERVEGLELKLERGLSVRGRVLSASTRAPVSGASVSTMYGAERRATSDASGAFELRGLGKDERIRVTAEGFAETQAGAPLPAAPQEEWTLFLEAEGKLHGRFLDMEGKPVAGALVCAGYRGEAVPDGFRKAWDKTSRTDSRGTYRLSGVPAYDDYCLLAVLEEDIAFTWVQGISVGAGEERKVDLRLERGSAIRGRVRTRAGSGISGLSVHVGLKHQPCVVQLPYPEDLHFEGDLRWSGERKAVTGGSGEFEVSHLQPGSYFVMVSSELHGPAHRTVELEEGSEPLLDIVLEEGESVSGRVVDRSGRPVEGALVRVSAYEEGAYAHSNDEGFFTARGLRPGRASVDAIGFGVRSRDIACDIPSSGNLLTVEPEAVVSGKVVARDRRVLPDCSLSFFRMERGQRDVVFSGAPDAANRFTASLTPGKYFLEASAEGFACTRLEVDLSSGERREVVLELVRSGSVRLKLEADGADEADGWVYLDSPRSAPVLEDIVGFPQETVFEAVPPGPAMVTAVARDHGLVRCAVLVQEATSTQVTLSIPAIRGIFGRLTLRGEPVQGAKVMARGSSGSQEFRTVSDGFYQIEGLEPGTYTVLVDGVVKRSVAVTGNRAVQTNIDLATAVVSGTVTAGGKPAGGFQVAATDLKGESWSAATTDPEGRWSLELIAPEEYQISIGYEEADEALVTRSLAVREGQAEARLDIALESLPAPESEGPEDEE